MEREVKKRETEGEKKAVRQSSVGERDEAVCA